jgi:hypothetical protein
MMPGENVPFDEPAALAELEDLRLSIERARRRRREIDDEFEAFVRGFKKPYEEPEADAAHERVSPPQPSLDPLLPFPSEIGTPAAFPVRWDVTAPPPAAPQSGAPAVDLPAGLIAPPAKRRRHLGPAAALGVAAAVAALLTRSWRAAPQQASAGAPPVAAVPPAPARPAPAPVAVVNRGPQLNALRRVWVRVLVDGNRVLERELQAGETVPLGAGRTIVIRTGDAGAVRLSIDGHDGPLGRDGEVVTRTFNH